MSIVLAIGLTMGPRAALGATQKQPTQAREPFRYDPKGRRDPFVPLVRDGRILGTMPGMLGASKLVLSGVVWDPGGHSIALINDQEVKVGEMVGGYQVTDIRKDAVVLSDGGEPVVLQITFEAPPARRAPGTTKGR